MGTVTTPAATAKRAPQPPWETARDATRKALASLPRLARVFWDEERHWLLVLIPLLAVLIYPRVLPWPPEWQGPLAWFVGIWTLPDSALSFQPLVPLGAFALAWADREATVNMYRTMADLYPPTSKRRRGPIWLAVIGCVLMIAAYLMMLSPLAMIGFLLIAAGSLLHLYGWAVFQTLLRPLLFLFAMVPIPFSLLDAVTQRLQLGCAVAAGQALKLLYPSTRVNGNMILMDGYSAMVSGPCSGMGILMPVLVLTLWLGLFRKMKWGVIAVLLTAGFAISLLMNTLRIIVMGLVGVHNANWAQQMHDTNSWVFTALAFYLTFLIAGKIGPRKSRLLDEEL
jgi:exosortase